MQTTFTSDSFSLQIKRHCSHQQAELLVSEGDCHFLEILSLFRSFRISYLILRVLDIRFVAETNAVDALKIRIFKLKNKY